MDKAGLIALAETYGLGRRELQQQKLLAESFFDEFREQLADYSAASIRLNGFFQSMTSRKAMCAGVSAARIVLFEQGADVCAILKVDAGFAAALVDAIISGKAHPQSGERTLTAIEEHLLSNSLKQICFAAASRCSLVASDRRGDPPRSDAATEDQREMFLARTSCQIGGAIGGIELALAIAEGSEPVSHVSNAGQSNLSAERKARALLANAAGELVAVMGRLQMTLEEVRALGPGSILPLRALERGIAQVELRCGEQALFAGAIVEHRGWRRFMIQRTGVFDERAEQSRAR